MTSAGVAGFAITAPSLHRDGVDTVDRLRSVPRRTDTLIGSMRWSLKRPRGGLWGHPDFMKLWIGQSISEFGSQVSQLAIPWLAAVELHASPIQFSLLSIFGFLPFILFALPAWVWSTASRRRPILIVSDATRAFLLASIPLLWALGVLEMWHLLAIQFVVGVFTVFFDVAYQSYLPWLAVDRASLVEGNAKLQTTVSTSQVSRAEHRRCALIAAITAPYARVLDAVSFLLSTAYMFRIRKQEILPAKQEGAAKPKMLPELKEGLAYVVRHRYLRPIAACTGSSNFFGMITFTIFLLYAVRALHMSSFPRRLLVRNGRSGRDRGLARRASCAAGDRRGPGDRGARHPLLRLRGFVSARAAESPRARARGRVPAVRLRRCDLQHHAGEPAPGDHAPNGCRAAKNASMR